MPTSCSACVVLKLKQYKDARRRILGRRRTGDQRSHRPACDVVDTTHTQTEVERRYRPDRQAQRAGGGCVILEDVHTGLIYDCAGETRRRRQSVSNTPTCSTRRRCGVSAHCCANFIKHNSSHGEALKLFKEFDKQLPRYPLAVEAIAQLNKGEPLPPSRRIRRRQRAGGTVRLRAAHSASRQGDDTFPIAASAYL